MIKFCSKYVFNINRIWDIFFVGYYTVRVKYIYTGCYGTIY